MSLVYIDTLREGLGDLADLEHQRGVWLPNAPGKMDSFEEAVCRTYDDSGLGDALERNRAEELLTSVAIERLQVLGSLLSKVDVNQPVENLIASEEMERVRMAAQDALDEIPRA